MSERKKKVQSAVNTFSKIWVNRLLWFACIWISASYVLASWGYNQIAEDLSKTALTTIVLTIIPYFLKSFFETKEEKKLEFEKKKYEDSIVG